MMTFGDVLRELMAKHGLRQARIADAADIDHAHLSRMLAGQRPVSRESVDRIVFGCGFGPEVARRLYISAGFVPQDDWIVLLDPELQEAANTLHDETIPRQYRESLRLQISALVGITRQMVA